MMSYVILFILAFVLFNVIMGLSSVNTWVERKGSALIQDRIGANRAGAFVQTDTLALKPVFFVVRWMGILGVINTLLCDAVKALFKEDFVPEGTSVFIHALGPFLAVLPVFLAFAVIPLAPDFNIGSYHIRAQLAQLDAGVLFILAMGSVSVYGVALAGWTGNNKFSLLGGLRAAAQMISYELAMGITFVAVIVVYGTLDLYGMVEAQSSIFKWGVFTQPLSFIILFIVGMAETKRGPFDLPEAESELVAGYFTEYSGMKFLLFWLGEFAEIGLFSLILVLLFFGGWQIPLVPLDLVATVSLALMGGAAVCLVGCNILQGKLLRIGALFVSLAVAALLGFLIHRHLGGSNLGDHSWLAALGGHMVLMGKVMFFSVLQIVIRWTLPRFRYDQLMSLGWKALLPLSMVNLMVYGALKIARVI